MTAPRPAERQPGPLLQQVDRTAVLHNGRKLTYFGGCDYFRLSSHPKILRGLRDGLRDYGLNVAASRFTTGNHPIYAQLESALARFFGAESATVTSTGYMAGCIATQALAGEFSHAFFDAESHSAVIDSVPLLRTRATRFKRGDAADLSRRIRAVRDSRKIIVLSEGLFSHNGELAPLREYLAAMPRSGVLLVDDAHGGGVLGRTGKGSLEELDIPANRVIRTVTLSKAFGVYGGAVLGTRELQQRIYAASSMLVGNTPLPPPLASAALAALKLLRSDPRLRRNLAANVTRVKQGLRAAGLPAGHPSTPIVGVTPKDEREAAKLRKRLLARGIYPSFINYPGGGRPFNAGGTSYRESLIRNGFFRFAISSEHRLEQLDALIAALT